MANDGPSFEDFLQHMQSNPAFMNDLANQYPFGPDPGGGGFPHPNQYGQRVDVQLLVEAHHWKERGNAAIMQNDCPGAEYHYSQALEFALPGGDGELIGTLLSNRSLARMKMGKLVLAIQDADECIQMRPQWHKGYWRASQVHKLMGHTESAIDALFTGLNVCIHTMTNTERLDLLKEFVGLCVKTTDKTRQKCVKKIPISVVEWKHIICHLVAKNEWRTIKILLMGREMGSTGVAKVGDLKDCKIMLHTLKRNTTPSDLISWGQQLMIFMIKQGVSVMSLCESPNTTYLHCALELGLTIGSFDLLKYLFLVFSTTKEARNVTDSLGNNLLHHACLSREITNRAFQDIAINLLLNHNVNPALLNKKQQLPVQLLPEGHPSRSHLITRMGGGDAEAKKKRKEENGELKKQFQELKDKGKHFHTKENNYGKAMEFYSKAVDVVSKISADRRKEIGISDRDEAILYSNCCDALCKLKKIDEAYKYAKKCCKTDMEWFKGHTRMGKILQQKGKEDLALEAFEAGYECVKKSRDNTIKVDILMEVMLILDGKGLAEAKKVILRCSAQAAVWQSVIEKLEKENAWLAILWINEAGCFRDCNLSKVNFSWLLNRDAAVWVGWAQPLLLEILEQGGSLEYIYAEKNGDRPMHAAITMAMRTGSMDLLVYLLHSEQYQTEAAKNEKNVRGDTALHHLVKIRQMNYVTAQTIAKELLKFKFDPMILDKKGHQVTEPCRKSEKMYKILNTAIAQIEQKAKEEERKKQQAQKAKRKTTVEQEPITEMKVKKAPHECDVCQVILDTGKEHVMKKDYFNAAEKVCALLRKTSHSSQKHLALADKSMKILVEAFIKISGKQDVPRNVLRLPGDSMIAIVTKLSEAEKWSKVFILLKEYQAKVMGPNFIFKVPDEMCLAAIQQREEIGTTNTPTDLDFKPLDGTDEASENLACEVSLALFVKSNHSLGQPLNRNKDLELLYKFKATIDAEKGLENAIQKRDFLAVKTFLKYGVSPKFLSFTEGDTPLHAALEIGLVQEKGKFDVLQVLFDISKKCQPFKDMLNPSCQDAKSNTLFHIAATATFSKHSLKACHILLDNKVNPNLRNYEDKTAIQCLPKKEDRRAPFIRQAGETYPSVPVRCNSPTKRVSSQRNNQKFTGGLEMYDDVEAGEDASHVVVGGNGSKANRQQVGIRVDETYGKTSAQLKEECRKRISTAIDKMENFDWKRTRIEEKKIETPKKEPKAEVKMKVSVEEKSGEENEGGEEEEENEDEDDLEIDSSLFDDLDWEVECTAEVWKVLKDKKVPLEKKQRVIAKVTHLASGEWGRSLAKPLEGVPSTIKLFEAKLSKGERIIWELAIAFSPKLSETAERRLGVETGEESGAKGGRIYSEVIRVWDIVFKHDNISKSVEKIKKSHGRGEECIIQKSLKGIDSKDLFSGKTLTKRLPLRFMEEDDELPVAPAQRFFPPASANEGEYHIMKFYSFTSALVNNVLQNQEAKVDFPFRVTELEHAIINLQQTPPAPILLLGRSGTGKTTCCLYRLWSNFVQYWEKAKEIGGPWIPRSVTFLHQERQESESQDDTQSEEESGGSDDETSSNSSIEPLEGATNEGSDIIMDHLHQVFITKNAVLCSEVQKNFRELGHACPAAQDHNAVDENELPNRFQDFHPDSFPVFLTSRKFLLLLDASLPPPYFFERKEDWSLKREVEGWVDGDGGLAFIPDLNDDSDPEDEETPGGEEGEEINVGEEVAFAAPKERLRKLDPRREVTYEVFAHLWSKINRNGKVNYHPTLVWMEIYSFIEGSVEALSTRHGFISEDVYTSLGRKRAPNFTGDRNQIYSLFNVYLHTKRQKSYFDEGDVVFHLYNRMKKNYSTDWVIHQIYVDETQDFTQAELCLMIRCCQSPNHMFLTGDTAQSIMRGVAFRFSDLKSLFYYAKESMKALGKTAAVNVPKRVYQLTHNYRSHAGILHLASSVVDLMVEFFPESFDRLQKDKGLFDGPKPVVLESCSFSDLALVLRGNRRKTSQIEFGAHQAILVVSDAAREELPEELSLGLVLTIFESKGLEFDDILLYNFFKDSQARKEWRVVTEYLNYIATKGAQSSSTDENIVEIDLDVMNQPNRPRPLKFNPDEHKVLNSEFKHLYTALTRARVNVWIFDEDQDARGPMFEYFKAKKLVQIVEANDAETEGISDSVFAEKSTDEQWQKRGDEFYKHSLYRVAAKCYKKSGNVKKEKMALAQYRALEASRLRDNPRRLREEFLYAADEYMQCEMVTEAAKCLYNAREFYLSAQLYEKLGQTSSATALYLRHGKLLDAARVYEQGMDFRKAVDILVDLNLFDKAIDVVERFDQRKKDLITNGELLPEKMRKNAPQVHTQSIERLCYRAAEHHHKNNNENKMMAALDRLPKEEDKINFLLKKRYLVKAMEIMKEAGQYWRVAKVLQKEGRFTEALEYTNAEEHPQFRGECTLAIARLYVAEQKKAPVGHKGAEESLKIPKMQISQKYSKEEIEKLLEEAMNLLGKVNDEVGKAEANFLLGKIKKEKELIRTAGNAFEKKHFKIGCIACIDVLMNIKSDNQEVRNQMLIDNLEDLFELLLSFRNRKNNKQKMNFENCCKFYGLEESTPGHFQVLVAEGARFMSLVGDDHLAQETIPEEDIFQVIGSKLLSMAKHWVGKMVTFTRQEIQTKQHCEDFLSGFPCRNQDHCKRLHDIPTEKNYYDLFDCFIDFLLLHNILNSDGIRAGLKKEEVKLLTGDLDYFQCAQALYDLLFPRQCHPFILTTTSRITSDLFRYFQYHKEGEQVKRSFLELASKKWKEAKVVQRQGHTDMFIQMTNLYSLGKEDSTKLMMDHMIGTEQTFRKLQNDYKRGRSELDPDNLGIFYTNHGGLIYFRCLIDSIKDLHINKNPSRAFGSFIKCITFTAKNPRELLIPSFAHCMQLMEMQMVVAFAMVLKNSGSHIAVLPSSYLAAVQFYDRLNTSVRGRSTCYAAIQAYKLYGREQKEIFSRLNTLVTLMVGGHKYRAFNIIQDAFSEGNEEYIQSGESERVFILAVVMLCNSDYNALLPINCEDTLRQAISNIRIGTQYPPRLARAITAVQKANSRGRVIEILKELLKVRSGEYLYKCTWKWDTSGRSNTTKGILYEQITDLAFVKDRFYKPLSDEVYQEENTGKAYRDELNKEDTVENPEPEEVFDEDYAQKAAVAQSELAERKDAVEVISLFWKRCLFKKRVEKRRAAMEKSERSEEHEQNPGDEYLSEYIVDKSMCNICNIPFTASKVKRMESVPEDHQEEEEEEDEEEEEEDDEEMSSNEGEDEGALKVSIEEHENSIEHHICVSAFKVYKSNYLGTFLPVLKKVKNLRDKYLDTTNEEDHVRMQVAKNLNKELQSLDDADMKLKAEQKKLEAARKWHDTQGMDNALRLLMKSYQECENMAKKIEKEEMERAAAREEDDANKEDIYEEDYDEDQVGHVEEVAKAPERKGAQKMRSKKKSKGKRK